MKKLVFEIPELEQIDINGDIFEIHKSDVDVLNKSAELTEKYKGIDKIKKIEDKIRVTSEGAKELTDFLDEVLGDGALHKISRGRPVSFKMLVDWLYAICGEINRGNDEYIADKYE